MSKYICTMAVDGAAAYLARAEKLLSEAIAQKGESCAAGFPDTAYYLPIIYSFTGKKIATLADLREVLGLAKDLMPERPSDKTWLPYLGGALDAGAAALFACEVIECCKYLIGPNPVEGIWLGAASDPILRERGVEFVDGTAPGFAAITGAAPSPEIAVKIARELQEKNLYVFMAGSTGGVQFAEQLAEAGVQLGWETRLVPFGKDVSALVYALGFANRAALSFGAVKPGDFAANLRYNKSRIFAFVLAFGEIDAEKYALAAGAINYGFPVISDTDIPEILPTGVCTYEHVVANVPHAGMVEKALEVRGCKVKVSNVPIPVAYGSAFEGERIRKADVFAEFGGNLTEAFEFVSSVDLASINDGEIEIVGKDMDEMQPGECLPLAIWVEVAGRKMAAEFEPILERQMHHLINAAEGIMHIGQRDIVWIRVSKAAYERGVRLKHIGEIIHARFLSDYPALVDKVKVTLITEPAEVKKRIAYARTVYIERNKRLAAMTDESVEVFYSCLLCQSFAPNHVCIITPERLGLCGAYNWLDARAAHEIDETGPNQPVSKGECLDSKLGLWKNVNDYVYQKSHKAIEAMTAYSLMRYPMTSCGCFECIVAYVPECNGAMVVHREFPELTPVGLKFSSLAGNVGGGQQTPGFMGCGKAYLTSKKFLSAEGGHTRLVWMPKALKELLGEDFKTRLAETGQADLFDKICDETIATDPAAIRAYMEKVKHPALAMPDMDEGASDDLPGMNASAAQPSEARPAAEAAPAETDQASAAVLTEELLAKIKAQVAEELREEIRASLAAQMINDMMGSLASKYLGQSIAQAEAPAAAAQPEPAKPKAPSAASRLSGLSKLPRRQEQAETPIAGVTLGATKAQGGTRGRAITLGKSTAMPFHLFEGEMPNPPVVAMEVFDTVSEKFPQVLRDIYGETLADPAAMARLCVEKYGAEMISLRLDGTHPERGDLSPASAVETVKKVLAAVDVPLIITGHSHFERVNDVFKAVAQACAGENLLLNWAEQNNYRTIAAAALANGHCVVAQSPIDVNIAKQLNILLTNMSLPSDRILIDPMTGALGYGLEYTYSVMERIRLTALGGDNMLAFPMIVSPGQECAKLKELKASKEDFPAWGELGERAALWELSTAVTLLEAGADLLIMYHPEAAMELKRTISGMLDKAN